MRPLLTVENNKLKIPIEDIQKESLTFENLKESGYIEYLDVEEEESALIAMDLTYLKQSHLQYTHC
jgi:hypothetical protein